jgi:hypothetical protein
MCTKSKGDVNRMNKKDIAEIRKEFKEDTYKLKFKEFYSAYIKKENGVIHKELIHFDNKDDDTKELLFNNFKKILSSSVDTKLFELDFIQSEEENLTQNILVKAVNSENAQEYSAQIDMMINKIINDYRTETDIVVNVLRAEYIKGTKRSRSEDLDVNDESLNSFEFVLCSVNKIEVPKKVLTFDFENKEFCTSSSVEVIVNLNSPLEGFMFPTFEGGFANVNKVAYYSSKAKQLNSNFVEDILNCSTKFTAEDEKECFHNIITAVVGNKVKAETIQEIYTKISEKSIEDAVDEDTTPIIGVKDIKKILVESGVEEVENVEEIFEQNCGVNYDFKVSNVLPDLNTKSIKITNQSADINITPKDLNLVRQVRDKNGRKCLLIEINEDVVINGFELQTEDLEV